MGLSVSFANIVFFALVFGAFYYALSALSDYYLMSSEDFLDFSGRIEERLSSSISISSVTADDTDILVYVLNDGRTNLDTGCLDYYVNRDFLREGFIMDERILDDLFEDGVWNPGETLIMQTNYPIDSGEHHEMRVVSCEGVSAATIFFKP
jgi:hypothetical protein